MFPPFSWSFLSWVRLMAAMCVLAGPAWGVETYFIDKGGSFNGVGGYWYQQFTLGSKATFVLRFTSDFGADCAIVSGGELGNFINNRSFSGYAAFDNQYGTKTVTLGPGTYYVGVRAQSQVASAYRLELDYDIVLPSTAKASWSFVDLPIQGNEYVDANGGRMWHGFTIQAGYRYFIDGCNPGGMGVYILPASELAAFNAGGSFQYYTDYSGTDAALPGLSELELPPGTYYLAVYNTASVDRPVTYTMERWKESPVATGGLDLAGPARWQTKGKRVRISVEKVTNFRDSGKSGSLRLRLWAVKKRYKGGGIRGYVMGTRNLNPLKAGYHYPDIRGAVPLTRPPRGRYYTVLTLEEFTASGWVVRDFLSFPGKTKF